MGIWQRIKAIFGANINAMLDGAEDPKAALDQIIRDMGEQMKTARGYLAEAVVNHKKLEREATKHREAARDYREKAKIILSDGDESNDYLAKEALMRQKEQEQLGGQYESSAARQKQQVETLQKNIQVMERKIHDAQSKRNILMARQTVARTQEAVTAALSATGGSSQAFQAFENVKERIEDKIERTEAMAQIEGKTVDQQLEEVSFGRDVDAELESLKKELLLEAESRKELPPGQEPPASR